MCTCIHIYTYMVQLPAIYIYIYIYIDIYLCIYSIYTCIYRSDGRRYSYLLKGREDLHLDERMMQLLDIVNVLLRQDRASHARCLSARSYAVIAMCACMQI